MSARNYTLDDYGACRWVKENNVGPGLYYGTVATLGPLTPARAARLKLLNLADGVTESTSDGDVIRLAGLGVKTANEAERLGIAAVTTAVASSNSPSLFEDLV